MYAYSYLIRVGATSRSIETKKQALQRGAYVA
jgi:hypothetical protein